MEDVLTDVLAEMERAVWGMCPSCVFGRRFDRKAPFFNDEPHYTDRASFDGINDKFDGKSAFFYRGARRADGFEGRRPKNRPQ